MFYIFIFVIGIIVGSFLNVVILRLKNGGKIINARSHCPHCHHQLSAKDMVPILSFFFQHGKCQYCHKKISWQYPLVELATGLLFVLATYNIFGGVSPGLILYHYVTAVHWIRDIIFICFLIVIFVYDFRWYLILDKVTIPAMIIAIILNLLLGLSWFNLLIGAIVGFGFFGVQFLISRGKWIGGGDLRLGALMGLMLGWANLIVALFFSYIIGAIFSVGLIVLGRKKLKSQIPFGTFLAIGTIIALFWGEAIIRWYLNLF